MKLTRIAPLVLVAAILLCTVSCAKQKPKEGRLVVNGTELEETVMFVSDERMEFMQMSQIHNSHTFYAICPHHSATAHTADYL